MQTEITPDTAPGTRFTLAVRPTHHPRNQRTGTILRTWTFEGGPNPDVALRCDVEFDADDSTVGGGRKTTIAAYCLRAEGRA